MNRMCTLFALAFLVCAWAIVAPGVATAGSPQATGAAKLWHTPLVIAAADFRNDGNNLEGYVFSPDGYIYGAGSSATMYAPVYLPDGVSVSKLTAHVFDNSDSCADLDITVTMRRTRLDSGVSETMASAATSTTNPSPQAIVDDTIDNPVIDNANYSYFVYATLCSASHQLTTVTIGYAE